MWCCFDSDSAGTGVGDVASSIGSGLQHAPTVIIGGGLGVGTGALLLFIVENIWLVIGGGVAAMAATLSVVLVIRRWNRRVMPPAVARLAAIQSGRAPRRALTGASHPAVAAAERRALQASPTLSASEASGLPTASRPAPRARRGRDRR